MTTRTGNSNEYASDEDSVVGSFEQIGELFLIPCKQHAIIELHLPLPISNSHDLYFEHPSQ